MKLTRRKLAAVLASGTALAQAPSAAADDEMKAARKRNQDNAEVLAREPIPTATEPAFQFKA